MSYFFRCVLEWASYTRAHTITHMRIKYKDTNPTYTCMEIKGWRNKVRKFTQLWMGFSRGQNGTFWLPPIRAILLSTFINSFLHRFYWARRWAKPRVRWVVNDREELTNEDQTKTTVDKMSCYELRKVMIK